MKQLRDTVWQRRGTSWLWDTTGLYKVAKPSEVVSLRQWLRTVGHWPDDLPSGGGNTMVVAGRRQGLRAGVDEHRQHVFARRAAILVVGTVTRPVGLDVVEFGTAGDDGNAAVFHVDVAALRQG